MSCMAAEWRRYDKWLAPILSALAQVAVEGVGLAFTRGYKLCMPVEADCADGITGRRRHKDADTQLAEGLPGWR